MSTTDPENPKFDAATEHWMESVLADNREGTASAENIEKLQQLLLSDKSARLAYRHSNEMNYLLECATREDALATDSAK